MTVIGKLTEINKCLQLRKSNLMKNPNEAQYWITSAQLHRALHMNEWALLDLKRAEMLFNADSHPRTVFDCYLEFAANAVDVNRLDIFSKYMLKSLDMGVPASQGGPDPTTIEEQREYLIRDFPPFTESGDIEEADKPGQLLYPVTFGRAVDLELLNNDLRQCSENLMLSSTAVDQYGLFATNDINAGVTNINTGELVLTETTRLCATSRTDRCENCTRLIEGSSVQCERCGTHYCSAGCMNEAFSLYHSVLCSKVKSESYQNVLKQSRRCKTSLAHYFIHLLKIYTIAIKEDVSPAEVLEIKTLRSSDGEGYFGRKYNYNMDHFYFKLLGFLDISPFQPRGRFDFETYKKVVSKFGNNIFGEHSEVDIKAATGVAQFSSLFRFASFMNHSCVPNAGYNNHGNKMQMHALKRIKKGEEVCHPYTYSLSKIERGERLYFSYGFDCKCSLCVSDKSPSYVQTAIGKQMANLYHNQPVIKLN